MVTTIQRDDFIMVMVTIVIFMVVKPSDGRERGCHITPVIHVLEHPNCAPKPIPSFACTGTCTSYVQVSGSKFWEMERSCMCCQEVGEREATVTIFCPRALPRFRRVITRAPVDCMCRPCTSVERGKVLPQEIATFIRRNQPRVRQLFES
ncbi:Burs (predicted) [Pycnogonum litorale]